MSVQNRNSSSDKYLAFFESLRPAREACIAELRNLRPATPHYHMMYVIIAALDVAAEFFTKRRSFYFSGQPDVIGRNLPDART